MDVPTLLTAIASHSETVAGIKSAHYPATNFLNESELPALVLYWGGPDETTIEPSNASGGSLWLPAVMGQLLVARVGDTPREFATVDSLLTPLVDAFAVPVNTIPALAGKVHRCHITRIRSSLQLGYAGHEYYGAELSWSIKFHRRTP